MVRAFLYRCPVTGNEVQGHEESGEGPIDPSLYKPLRCVACGRLHLVNPYTGKLLADSDNFKRP